MISIIRWITLIVVKLKTVSQLHLDHEEEEDW